MFNFYNLLFCKHFLIKITLKEDTYIDTKQFYIQLKDICLLYFKLFKTKINCFYFELVIFINFIPLYSY